jgi:hypothetical protein
MTSKEMLLCREIQSGKRVVMHWLMALLLCGVAWAATVQAAQAPDADWWSAIRRDDVSEVQTKLLRGVDVNAFNALGNPALTQAAREQSWKVFDLLKSAPGVQVDLANAHNETALMYLCILGETQRALALIQVGAQVNRLGWTPLHYAASKGQLETAKMLIRRGAIVNAPGPDGTTPLMMAALWGKADTVQLLLSHGADPTMFNSARETAVDWALKRNNTALAESLKKAAHRVQQARARQGQGAGTNSDTMAPQTASGQGQMQAPDTSSDDAGSFSRYFDLGRFEDSNTAR